MDVAVGTEVGTAERSADAHLREWIAPNVTLLAVADGFGGRDAAFAAAAVAEVREFVVRRHRVAALAGRALPPGGLRALVLGALEHANARVYALSGSNDDTVTGGVSLTAVLLAGGHAVVGHVGDARAYLGRLGEVEALTADDALFRDRVFGSTATAATAYVRNVLWRSLGTQAKLEASVAHVELLAGDQLVLCTDGFHRRLHARELAIALDEPGSATEIVARLLETVRTRLGCDDATVLLGRDLLAPTPAPDAFARRRRAVRWSAATLIVAVAATVASYVLHLSPR